jgi:adenosyl cobinamide kinase/adenosyl cobinamide phosphate guanylyltransferase
MPFSSIKKNQYILLDGFHLLLADVFFKKAKKKKKKKKKKIKRENIYELYCRNWLAPFLIGE